LKDGNIPAFAHFSSLNLTDGRALAHERARNASRLASRARACLPPPAAAAAAGQIGAAIGRQSRYGGVSFDFYRIEQLGASESFFEAYSNVASNTRSAPVFGLQRLLLTEPQSFVQ